METHDQMPRSAASGLGLHCLPMSHKKDARLIWVKKSCNCNFPKDFFYPYGSAKKIYNADLVSSYQDLHCLSMFVLKERLVD